MTIIEQIKSRLVRLPTPQQKTVLNFLDTLEIPAPAKRRSPSRRKSRKAEVSEAIRGIAGMWKDRTDLPKDPVEAVKVLRSRMRSRGRNG